MLAKLFFCIVFSLAASACAPSSEVVKQPEPQASVQPIREESVGFLAGVYKLFRDTERATYDSLYSIRDGYDSIVYDVQKDYYQDYQK